jgi:hypothetical protein
MSAASDRANAALAALDAAAKDFITKTLADEAAAATKAGTALAKGQSEQSLKAANDEVSASLEAIQAERGSIIAATVPPNAATS